MVRIRPGDTVALRYPKADLYIFGGVVPGEADALDRGGQPVLIPIHPFRQTGDDGEIALIKAHRAGILARGAAHLGGTGGGRSTNYEIAI